MILYRDGDNVAIEKDNGIQSIPPKSLKVNQASNSIDAGEGEVSLNEVQNKSGESYSMTSLMSELNGLDVQWVNPKFFGSEDTIEYSNKAIKVRMRGTASNSVIIYGDDIFSPDGSRANNTDKPGTIEMDQLKPTSQYKIELTRVDENGVKATQSGNIQTMFDITPSVLIANPYHDQTVSQDGNVITVGGKITYISAMESIGRPAGNMLSINFSLQSDYKLFPKFDARINGVSSLKGHLLDWNSGSYPSPVKKYVEFCPYVNSVNDKVELTIYWDFGQQEVYTIKFAEGTTFATSDEAQEW